MSLRNRLVLPFILSTLALLAGCSNSTNNPVPPPTGGFTNTNFNGTYTFSVFGTDGSTYAAAGSFTACGCTGGTISGGTVDLTDATPAPGVPLLATGSTVTSSSTYNITQDGRGTVQLLITNANQGLSAQVELAFVLTSSSHGLIIQFDGKATGSGTIDLQPTPVTQSSIANTPFAFSLSGTDVSANLNPLATVGAFTLDANGTITTGVQDYNYSFVPSTNLGLSGVVGVGSGTAPGTATLVSSFYPSGLTFDVYPISATHLKVIESDGLAVVVGDAFAQTSASIPSGNLVFNMAGFDVTGESPFVAGGLMSSGGTTISSGSEDVNEGGVVDGGVNPPVPLSFGGSFASSGGGRSVATLSNFFGGTLFAAYPSSGGIFMLEIDNNLGLIPGAGMTSGVAMPQSVTSIAAQGYGLNLTGLDLANDIEVDQSGEFITTSSALSGLVDINDGGATSTKNLAGSYTVNSNGAGAATFTSGGMAGMFFYVADSSNVLYISTDPNQVALGSFQSQNTPTSMSNATQQHLAMLRSVHPPHSAAKHAKPLFRKTQ
jgi:hypothetical protein